MRLSRTLAPITVLLLFAGGGCASVGNPVPTADHIIEIREGGVFVPDMLTVRVGESVAWVNHDTALRWPASDPHPTHTGAPGLDPLGELSTGESFVYVFQTVGTYTYHDHAVARFKKTPTRGTVVVEP